MTTLSLVGFTLVLTVILYLQVMVESTETVEKMETRRKEALPLWFGARIGRKKRNPADEVVGTEREVSTLLEALRESPWSIVTLNNEDNRRSVNFVPRLGRESGEVIELGVPESDFENNLLAPQRNTPPFVPRLGRNLFQFIPRLGRESSNRMQ